MFRSLLVSLLFCGWAGAQAPQPSPPIPIAVSGPPAISELSPAPKAPVQLPGPLELDVGHFRWFSADKYTGKVKWKFSGAGIGSKFTDKPITLLGAVQGSDAIESYDVPAKSVIVWGVADGEVTMTAWGVIDGEAVEGETKTILVGRAKPKPPKPNPNPKPINPPAPVTDPLAAILQAAYAKDGSPAKCAADLSALYLAAATKSARSDAVQTVSDLFADMSVAAASIAPPPVGQNFREAIAVELKSTIGTDPKAAMTPALRDRAAAEFIRISKLLAQLK